MCYSLSYQRFQQHNGTATLLNKSRAHVLLYYLSHRRNVKLIAATQFKD